MMKIFFGLLFLTLIGAGVLGWLIYNVPVDSEGLHADKSAEVVAHEGGVKIIDKEGGEHEMPKPEEKKEEEHAAEAAPEASKGAKLSVSSEPVPAKVMVNGKEVGKTPMDLPVTDGAQEVRLVAEGYMDFTRELPAFQEGMGNLEWKVQLDRKGGQRFAKALPPPVFLTAGKQGPFFLQVRSLPEENFQEDAVRDVVASLRTDLKMESVVACRVSLGARGRWNRILVGPYDSRKEAMAKLPSVKGRMKSLVFWTGAQNCL